MSYTKSQVANFINDEILFRFSISKEFTIEYIDYEKFFTFEELERIIKSNYDYWNSINESSPEFSMASILFFIKSILL